jgi:hypothetical protein
MGQSNPKRRRATMERIIDYLAEEEAKEKAKRERKTGKHQRVAKLLKTIANVQTQPVIDFLGD